MKFKKISIVVLVICAVFAMVASGMGRKAKEEPAPDKKTSQTEENKTEASANAESEQPKSKNADADKEAKLTEGEEKSEKAPGEEEKSEGQTPADAASVTEAVDDELVPINLDNVEMKSLIKTIGNWTGKSIIPTNDEVLKVRLTIFSPKDKPKSEALSLIYEALRIKGFIAEQRGDNIFLKPLSQAKLGAVPTVGADEPLARIVDKSQIVEKFFKLENASPSKLVVVVTSLTADYGHVTAIENASSIAVIDTVQNLMRIERVIKELDIAESEEVVEEVFELANADAIEVVQLIQMIMKADKGGSAKTYRGKDGGKKDGGAPATSVVVGADSRMPVTLIPVPKHKWILARGMSDDIKVVREWIDRLDTADSVEPEQSIISVRHVDAREIVNIVKRKLVSMPGEKLKTSIVIEALPQSKQVVIFGSEENRKEIERLIAQIDVPTEDVVSEDSFKLKHADPDQIKQNIEDLFSATSGMSPYMRRNSYQRTSPEDTVNVVSYPMLKQITVIASDKNLAKIRILITEEWDVPLDIERDQYRILNLRNSDPVQMADLLTQLFSEGESDGYMSFMRMIYGGSASNEKIVGSLYGTLIFEPVPDTKKLIVISKVVEAYAVIEDLVNELDGQDTAELPKVIPLNYADPEILCDQLNAILNEPGTISTISRSERGLSVDSDSTTDQKAGKTEAEETVSDKDVITPWWNRGYRPSQNEMPPSNLIGKVRFIPVFRSKAILVLAPPEYMESIEDMVKELDRPEKQVVIKAVIMRISHSDMTSLGMQISTNPAAFGNVGINALQGFMSLLDTDTHGSLEVSSSLDVYGLLDLLVKNTDARVLNQPTLYTKDNKEAVFIKAKNIAFIESDQTNFQDLNNVNRNYNYRDVGLTLRVRPNITPERAVDLTIYLEVSTIEDDLINSQIATNKLDTTTNVILADGETVMLGGILFQNNSKVTSKVPLLGDIPLIGALFTHEDTNQTNDELLVFLTPNVVDGLKMAQADLEVVKEPTRRMEETVNQLNELFQEPVETTPQVEITPETKE